MIDKILPWIGGVFAVVGLILIFFDVISTIKRRDKTKTNIVGLVLLSVGVVGYAVTDLILPAAMPDGSGWPALASLVWILMFWVYVVLDAVTTWGDIRVAHRKKKQRRADEQISHPDARGDEAVEEAERIWEEHSHDLVQEEQLQSERPDDKR